MSVLIKNPRERERFLRFAVVGVIGAVVDFGTMNLLTQLFQMELVPAGVLSFIAAIISNFLWNRYWTYPDSRSKPVARQLLQFAVVSVAGLAIRVPVLALLDAPMHRLFENLPFQLAIFSPDFLAKNISLAIAVVIVMFWNFFINRYWTYGDVTS